MSKNVNGRPVRSVVLVAIVIVIVIALRNIVADKGGTYDPSGSGIR